MRLRTQRGVKREGGNRGFNGYLPSCPSVTALFRLGKYLYNIKISPTCNQ